MNRRGFLTGLLASVAVAPAIARTSVPSWLDEPIGVPGRNEFGSYIDYGDWDSKLDNHMDAVYRLFIEDDVRGPLVSEPFRLPPGEAIELELGTIDLSHDPLRLALEQACPSHLAR